MTDPWQRDSYGRPMVPPASGDGAPVPYTRASTFGKYLEDTTALGYWQAWQAVRGTAVDPHTAADVIDHEGSTPRRLVETLIDAGGGRDKAARGTARHALVAMRLEGKPLPDMPTESLDALDAVADTVRGLGTLRGVEVDVVNDEYHVAGTADYWITAPDGTTIVADLKTGRTVSPLSVPVQLVSYARGRVWRGQLRREYLAASAPRLVVIHAPQDSGRISVREVEPARAKALADLAVQIRAARKVNKARVVWRPVDG